jgi:hypothetical protein
MYICKYMYIRTVISRAGAYNKPIVNKPIQQHTAVHYYSWLRWTLMNYFLRQTVIHFCSWHVRRSFTSQVQFACCGCILRAFSWVCWRCLKKRKIWYFLELGNVNRILLTEWQEESYKLLSWTDLSSFPHSICLSHTIYHPSYLSYK